MTTINAAIVGLGWWGETIARTLLDSTIIRPVLGVDPDDGRREAMAGGDMVVTGSYADALSDPNVDVVVLCTPHFLHAEQIIAAAEAGKHVFCEKPFAVTHAEARSALEAVSSAGVTVGIGHERRFEPAVEALQQMLAEGALGTPLMFEGNFSQNKFLTLPPDNWRLSSELAPVGPLSATGIHLVDLAISMFGRPETVWARLATLATNFGNGDTLSVTLGFPSGATATVGAVLTTPFMGRVCVIGSEGWCEIRDRSHPEQSDGWDVRVTRADGQVDEVHYPPFAAVRENLERFADSISGRRPYPVTPDDIQYNVDTFEAIVRSARTGRLESV